jgi:hypothetical protein
MMEADPVSETLCRPTSNVSETMDIVQYNIRVKTRHFNKPSANRNICPYGTLITSVFTFLFFPHSRLIVFKLLNHAILIAVVVLRRLIVWHCHEWLVGKNLVWRLRGLFEGTVMAFAFTSLTNERRSSWQKIIQQPFQPIFRVHDAFFHYITTLLRLINEQTA